MKSILEKILSVFTGRSKKKKIEYDKALLLYRYSDIEIYKDLYDISDTISVFEGFKMRENLSFGENSKNVVQSLGTSYLKVDLKDGFTILQFKIIIEGEKVKKQYHFFEDKLFAFSEIYSYLKPGNNDKLLSLSLHDNLEFLPMLQPNCAFDFNNDLRLIYRKDVELAFYLIDTSNNLLPTIQKIIDKRRKEEVNSQ